MRDEMIERMERHEKLLPIADFDVSLKSKDNCLACPIIEGEGLCIKPERQIFSLESLGANVSTLIERCFDFSLEWSKQRNAARHVCAVGAFFY